MQLKTDKFLQVVDCLPNLLTAASREDFTIAVATLMPISIEPYCVLTGHKNFVTAIKLTSDCRFLISGDADGVVIKWDLQNFGEQHRVISESKHESPVYIICFDNNEQFKTVSIDGKIKFWLLKPFKEYYIAETGKFL